MTNPISPAAAIKKFAVGQPVPRNEDPRLLRGKGLFTGDISLPNQLYGFMLRSPFAHGVIRALDTTAAGSVDGVRAVYTFADLKAAGYNPFPCGNLIKNHDGTDHESPARHALAGDKVKHVGEGLAFIVAESLDAARDGAEAVTFDIEPLPALIDPERALDADSPPIHQDARNLCLDWRFGDLEAVDAAVAGAAHVTRMRIPINRVIVAAMEPRAAMGEFDAARGRLTLHVTSQGVWGMRETLARRVMGLARDELRVLSHDIGGSFGMKSQQYPENLLVLHAARELGRPVKWVDDRSGSFLSDFQGRDMIADAALALDAEGDILAMRIDMIGNLGAYATPFGPYMPAANIPPNAASVYKTPLLAVTSRCVFTNTVPIAPYRGAGRPEGNYIMERLIETAARETGRDPVALRRRNLVPAEAIPFRAASDREYDSGDFPAVLADALAAADWSGFETRRKASQARGLLRGRAVTCYLEVTAGTGKEMGGIRFRADGRVTILTGSLDQGQGHATAFAQVVAGALGIPADRIDLVQGDSDELLTGGGTGGSKSIMSSGIALLAASDGVVEKGRRWAGHLLEAAEQDIAFSDGEFRVVGTDRAIPVLDLAARVAATTDGPSDLPDRLDHETVAETPPASFPNGCHICEVEIDPETGAVRIDRYAAVNDFGTLVNPMLVAGQTHGGIVQGVGQALMETAVYDADGQLLTGSFTDYALPRAADLPAFALQYHPVPATTNLLGVKGCGEAGTSGAIPTVINAVIDALAPLGVTDVPMPATPEAVWRAIRNAAPRQPGRRTAAQPSS
ncbi:MAG: xanthine dehydrogenase family protein molybdopterin-binding subunit [Rhodospirillales bacterium]|nr:MAG: xanthine dehydrogenase family protein molybdopterin-binding subunit [Rhodospirillales bacterium]